MGVPKFFRWLSERYPLINQPIHCPPKEETKEAHGFPASALSWDDGTTFGGDDQFNNHKGNSNGGGGSGSDNKSDYKNDYKNGDTSSDDLIPPSNRFQRHPIKNTHIPHIMPEFDRLYLDMNGIIHCCSHNNSEEEEVEKEKKRNGDGTGGNGGNGSGNSFHADSNPPSPTSSNSNGTSNPSSRISEEQIFQNINYYLDRLITDIVQPKQLVYFAVDGVAPRAKLNQQRSRRYRSGSEREIEMHLMTLQRAREQKEKNGANGSGGSDGDGSREYIIEADGGGDDGYWWEDMANSTGAKGKDVVVRGAQRFSGTIETSGASGDATPSGPDSSSPTNNTPHNPHNPSSFHSNSITPGTPFLHKCSQSILQFLTHKLSTDPRWAHLTLIFSGHDVPGEGEHKIMEFIRHEKNKPEYDPNLRHCVYGQDGDLIMLGLATHEANFCLLREEVVFDMSRRKAVEGIVRRRCEMEAEEVRERERRNGKMEKREKTEKTSTSGKGDTNNSKSDGTPDSQDSEGDPGDPSHIPPAIQSYIHNPNYELLHLSLLRDYLSLEFETQPFHPSSPFQLEPTIDDFVFLTFFVGNDFLPHMPALDIGDEAFDLLFFAYKGVREGWIGDGRYRRKRSVMGEGKDGDGSDGSEGGDGSDGTEEEEDSFPYLTDSGALTSATRLESFLTSVGSYEDIYHDNKRFSMSEDNERMRRADAKAGRASSIPSEEVLEQVEMAGRELYRDMLLRNERDEREEEEGLESVEEEDGEEGVEKEEEEVEFMPVTSTKTKPLVKYSNSGENTNSNITGGGNEMELKQTLGRLLRSSLSPEEGGVTNTTNATTSTIASATIDEEELIDLKGRYYYDKFKFTPFDSQKHLQLRREYMKGLVWNLEYYYKGCVSWEWYYPYHYGPMISDLVGLDGLLKEIDFFDKEEKGDNGAAEASGRSGVRRVAGEPLRPFEQLLGCLPPSSSYLLPEPYRWLMTSKESPLIDSYPESFQVDMNGKRWPWEAVTLLPFVDSEKLMHASRTLVDQSQLTEEEKQLNEFGEAFVLKKSNENSSAIIKESLQQTPYANIAQDANVTFRPELNPHTILPAPCFPTLKTAPVKHLNRRKLGINIFGLKSRYRTALLELEGDLPALPPAQLLAQKFIGTTVYFRYPFMTEGFVCAVGDYKHLYRGTNKKPLVFHEEKRQMQLAQMHKELQAGEGMSGTGGWVLPPSDVTLRIRPLETIETLPDGKQVKVFCKWEMEVPFFTALWSPVRVDPRMGNLPVKLEKDPYQFGFSKKERNGSGNNAGSGGNGVASLGRSFSSTFASKKSMASSRGFSTFGAMQTLQTPLTGPYLNHKAIGNRLPINIHRRQTLHRSTKLMRSGDPRRRVIGTAGALAFSTFLIMMCLFQVDAVSRVSSTSSVESVQSRAALMLSDDLKSISPTTPTHSYLLPRGGEIDDGAYDGSTPTTPPIEFAHGTTTISFVFQGGIVAAVDSRASIGNFVGSKTTQKVLPVSRNILGTMAGGAADCSFWIRYLRSEAKLHELVHDGRSITVARASRILSNVLYQNRGLDLSIGTMIMGYDPREGFSIYYLDNTGVRINGDVFAVGSGSTFALGILDTEERRFEMTEEEAVTLGIKAIRHATLRDAMSGGYIGVYLITKDGWRKVFSEDLASISN